MFHLPASGGRFAVGATTFELAVPRRTVSGAKVCSAGGLKDALVLEEVAFTAYYPADVPLGKTPRGLDWLLRPSSVSLRGYSSYSGLSLWVLWPLVYFFGVFLKIPVHPEAPLLDPHRVIRAEVSKPSPWPLVVFSHGLGGSRTAYSQLCTRIASSGRLVLAMEHRDGSAHAVIPSTSDPIPYIKETSLVWPPDHPGERNNMFFRGEQLDFRRREIYHAVRAVRKLVRDGREDTRYSLKTMGDTAIDWSRWSRVGTEMPIECEENVVLMGHSFGGATVLSILSNGPPDNERPIPVQKVLLLDPWLEPLPTSVLLPHQKYFPSIRVINSEKFTLWKDHFERLVEIGKCWAEGRWELLTIVRSEHISFSDFLVLPLISRRAARLILDKISHLSLAFLDGDGAGAAGRSSAKKMEVRVIGQRADGRPKRQMIGNLCDVIFH